MKKIISILFIVICLYQVSNSQSSGWFWQNPLPQGNKNKNIKFFDSNTGWCVNSNSVMKTINGGLNWQLNYASSLYDNNSICIVDQNIGYLVADSNRLYKSQNGGINWNYLTTLVNAGGPELYFLSAGTGFALSRLSIDNSRGTLLLRTSDGGISWNPVISDSTFQIYAVSFPNQMTGFVAGTVLRNWSPIYLMRILKTTNGGVNWDSIPSYVNMDARALCFSNESTGFTGGYNGSLGKLYRTTDSGQNWVNEISSDFNRFCQIQFVNQNTGFAIDNVNKLYRTTDTGANWSVIDLFPFLGSNNMTSVYFLNYVTGYAAGWGGLLALTTNSGDTWVRQSNGRDNWIWSVKFSDAQNGFAGGGYGKLFRTTNAGSNWSVIQFPGSPQCEFDAIAQVTNNTWYIGEFFSGRVYKTVDFGLSWDTLHTNPYGGLTSLEFVNEMTGYGVSKYNYFLKTTNGGLNWLTDNSFGYVQFSSLDFIDANTGCLTGSRTFKTTNSGITWDSIPLNPDGYKSKVQFLNSNTGYIAGYPACILKTTDSGLNWIPYFLAEDNQFVSDIYFADSYTGYAVYGNYIYKTTDGGSNYYKLRTCTSNTLTSVYFTDPNIGYCVGSYETIIKTTNGGGEPIGIQPISNEVPMSFSLYQNYPNPFNPTTVIKFQVASYMFVKLVVYDILGREVTTLVNEQLKPGTYEVEWNASNYASGVYFYQLNVRPAGSLTSDFSQTRKMVLIK